MRRTFYAFLIALLLATVPAVAQQLPGQLQTCQVINSSAITLTAFTGAGCVQREPQVAFYITDIVASATVASSGAVDDNYLTLKYGTGTNCGTGTVVLWASYTLALQHIVSPMSTPLKVPGGKDLCWIHSVAGNKTFIVRGYLGPQ